VPSEESTVALEQLESRGRRLGPHYVPMIPCGACGHEHHIDATTGEYLGRCVECSGYLRRPYEEEERQFWDFMDWMERHREAGR